MNCSTITGNFLMEHLTIKVLEKSFYRIRIIYLRYFCQYSISAINDFYLAFQVLVFADNILLSGDIELNPGPRISDCQNLSVSHWNVNSLSVHDFTKLDLIKAFNSNHDFDIICLSETYLNSSFDLDLNELTIDEYTMVRADHPLNVRRGGVCIYYKTCLPLRVLNFQKLRECLFFEIEINDKKLIFSVLYRSPS